jgi:hypothetical protein
MRLTPSLALFMGALIAACAESTGPGAVATVTVSGAPVLLETGQTAQLATVVRDADGALIPNVPVVWRVEGTAVTVDPTGFLTAVAAGSARVVATAEAVAGDLDLVVETPTIAEIIVSPESTTILVGATAPLAASARSRAGAVFINPALSWESSDTTVAAVSATGAVTGRGTGTALVVVASASVADTARVVVVPVTAFEVSATTAQPRQGDVLSLLVIAGGSPLDPAQFAWTVLPATAGLVTPRGMFVGYQPGAVRIVARTGAAVDTLDLAVTARGVGGTFTAVGQAAVPSRYTSDLWVHGAYAYTGTWGTRGTNRGDRMYAWNIATPATPVLTDSVVVNAGTVNDVKVSASGAIAVITHEGSTDGLNGITLLSLADPAHPAVITRYTTNLTTGVHNAWIDGNIVYVVADGGAGLRIVDVTTPASPFEIAAFSAGSSVVHDVYVRDGLAFVSHWDAGLVILDVGNGMRGGIPSAPVEVSRIALGGNTHNAWYWPAAGYVFVGEEDFGKPGFVHVVDVRDLTQPVEVATFALPSVPPHNFWIDEVLGVLYVGWYDHGLRAIDVSGALLGDLSLQGRALAALEYGSGSGCPGTAATCTWAPQLHEGRIFLSDMNLGLRIVTPSF